MKKTLIEIWVAVLLVLFGSTNLYAVAVDHVVTNNNDSGPGSLRQALLDFNDGDKIIFNLSAGNETITINSTLPPFAVGENMDIDGDNNLGSGINAKIQVAEVGSSDYPIFILGGGPGKTTTTVVADGSLRSSPLTRRHRR